jgi:hypothetical protein
VRAALGAGTNEDEAFVLLPGELPVYAGPIRLLIDAESISGTMQVRVVAYRTVATGFGRAPAAICRIGGTGLVAPSLSPARPRAGCRARDLLRAGMRAAIWRTTAS